MSLGYCDRIDGIPLKQGDILLHIPLPTFGIFPFNKINKNDDRAYKPETADSQSITKGDRGIIEYDLVDVIILTQSCDIMLTHQVLLAPLKEYHVPGNTESKKGKSILDRVNSIKVIRNLYLPDVPELGFARHDAFLAQAFTLDAGQLTEYVKHNSSFLMGLSENGVEYLQYRISLLFGRLAREDYSWASLEDVNWILAYKRKQLENCNKNSTPEKFEILQDEITALEQIKKKISKHSKKEFKRK